MHIQSLSDAQLDRPSLLTIGAFDGVHRGHQFLIEQLVAEARASERAAVVLTFFPHPDTVVKKVTGRYYLTTPQQRADLLLGLGVDVVITHPFDKTVRHMRAVDFVDELRQHLDMTALWATAGFALGYQREGDIDFLRQQGQIKGFTVKTVELVMADENGDRISSQAIRQALTEGNLVRANHYLGRPYRLAGEVIKGERRGHTIGFPTANLSVWEEQIVPQAGVYACLAQLGDDTFDAVTNIGYRPTFGGQSMTVETHLLDFDREIYGQQLALDFIARLRPEKKFDGIEALVAQIRQDIEAGRQVLAARQGEA